MRNILNDIILRLPFRSILRKTLMILPTRYEEYNQEMSEYYLGWIELRGIGLALAFERPEHSLQFDW